MLNILSFFISMQKINLLKEKVAINSDGRLITNLAFLYGDGSLEVGLKHLCIAKCLPIKIFEKYKTYDDFLRGAWHVRNNKEYKRSSY